MKFPQKMIFQLFLVLLLQLLPTSTWASSLRSKKYESERKSSQDNEQHNDTKNAAFRKLSTYQHSPSGRDEQVIIGQYIIKFADTVQDPSEKMTELIQQYEESDISVASIKWEYTEVFKGVTVTNVSKSLIQKLRDDPSIEAMETDVQYFLDGNYDIKNDVTEGSYQIPWSWGLDRIDQAVEETPVIFDNRYNYDFTGKGVTVALMDTGIQSTHLEFKEEEGKTRVRCAFNAFLGEPGEERTGCHDLIGHGTHIAGIVGGTLSGVAKKTNFLNVKVVRNSDGFLCVGSVLAGLDYVVSAKRNEPEVPMVLNLSFSGPRRESINDSLQILKDNNIIVVTSAGNDAVDACEKSPASASSIITVASSNYDDSVSLYSNYGVCVDLYAPGDKITSAWIRTTTDLVTLSGTSMSAAHVTGVIALILEIFPNSKPSDIEQNLKLNAFSGLLANLPYGSPNLLLRTIDNNIQK